MKLETVIILLGIIQLIMLICFFILCSNVGWIKKKLGNNGANTTDEVVMYLAMGEKEKAKEALVKLIMADPHIRGGIRLDYPKQISSYLGAYKTLMNEVGLEFNENDAIKYHKMIL